MSDEVDDLLRRAMKTLDQQIPAGTFDTLAARTLARLDDPALAEVPEVPEVAELPEVAEVPDELARERAIRAAHANGASDRAPRAAAADPVATAPAEHRRPRGRMVAIIGVGVAAAAGAMMFLSTRNDTRTPDMAAARGPETTAVVAHERVSQAPPVADKPGVESSPAPNQVVVPGSASPADSAPIAAAPPRAAEPTPPAPVASGSGIAGKGRDPRSKRGGGEPPVSKAGPKPSVSAVRSAADDATPDEAPLRKGKPAGPAQDRLSKNAGPATDRKSLAADDIKRGMAAVAADARACFAGTDGVASLDVAVLPSGNVAKVVVPGAFAGTPVARCVERAVRSATFPPWDGNLQWFSYSYPPAE